MGITDTICARAEVLCFIGVMNKFPGPLGTKADGRRDSTPQHPPSEVRPCVQ